MHFPLYFVSDRYCAKLPSDAFTHLTPMCRVCSASEDPPQFVAYLRLPVNSPIKEELKVKKYEEILTSL
jgi:endoribonuclease Dicer